MRIDAHQHFWKYDPRDYPWIDASMAVLQRDYGPDELLPLTEASGIDGTIAVQACHQSSETQSLLRLASEHPLILGVVGWVDLCAEDVLRSLEPLAATNWLCGIRHQVQDEPDERFLLRDDFCRGIELVGQLGLVYDILVFPRHLPVVSEFVAHFPDQLFVIDHLAKPPLRGGAIDVWASELKRVARYEHVACKLSGLVTEAPWDLWTAEDLHPCLDVALESFGPDRLLFGSDWPVCTLAASYDEVVGVVNQWSRSLTPSEQAKLFGDNATRVYGLKARG